MAEPSAADAAAARTGRMRLASPHETEALGRRLADALAPGDAVLLSGPLGAGKTALARAVVGARLGVADLAEAEIPSPTYTLAQTYDTPAGPVWHADLHRLGDPDEALELGLLDAADEAVLLVEWPERLGPHAPARSLTLSLSLSEAPEARELTWRAVGEGWDAAIGALGADAERRR